MRHHRTAAHARSTASALWLVALFVMLAVLGCSSEEEESDTPLNKIPLDVAVVKVGEKEISGAWLRNWCVTQQLSFERQGLPLKVDEYDLLRKGRELLTKMVIVAREAERLGLEVTEQQIQDKLAEEMERFDSTQRWLEILEKSGVTREERKQQIRTELMFAEYEEEVLAPKIEEEVLTPETLRAYYDKYQDKLFHRPHRVHTLHLMRAVPRDAPEQERQREREIIEQAQSRIEQGESFGDVAREVSSDQSAIEGGDIGWVTEQAPMPKDLKKAILELSEGEMTGVLESPHGLHVFMAKEVKQAGPIPFEEVEEDIRARIKREAMNRRMTEHVSQLREQLIQAQKLKILNLTPYIGQPLTPREAQQVRAGEGAGASGSSSQ